MGAFCVYSGTIRHQEQWQENGREGGTANAHKKALGSLIPHKVQKCVVGGGTNIASNGHFQGIRGHGTMQPDK